MKFETTIFLGIPKDFKVFHSSFGLTARSVSFSPKDASVINFSELYLAYIFQALLHQTNFEYSLDSFGLTGYDIVNDCH